MRDLYPGHKGANGFTLVELMVTLVLTGIAAAGMYRGYVSFAASYEAQEQLIEQNQNLRIGIQKMVREIRMAGYTRQAGATIEEMGSEEITFSLVNDKKKELETITYRFNKKKAKDKKLDRARNGGYGRSVIQNVEALNFVYLDGDRNIATVQEDVRFIQIAMVVKTKNEDFTHTNRESFSNLQGTEILPSQHDHFHRRLLTAEVECRNMAY